MIDNKLSIGIIGGGMIAEKHIKTFRLTGKAEITWIAEIRHEVLDNVTATYQIANGTNDYTDILNDPDVDVVIIGTPPHLHKQMCIDSIKAGKHVIVEKPVVLDPSDLDEILKVNAEHPEIIVTGCSARHTRINPKYDVIKEMISNRELGDIYYIHHSSVSRQSRPGIEYHPTAKWFLNKSISGGGPVLDWGVYDLSFHLGLLSDRPELQKVRASTMKQGLDMKDPETDIFDVEEHGFATMKFSHGLTYYWERASHANMEVPNETRIYGTRGGLKFGFCTWDSPEIAHFYLDDHGNATSKTITVDMSHHKGDDEELATYFVGLFLGEEKQKISLKLSKKHLEIIFEVYRAARDVVQ